MFDRRKKSGWATALLLTLPVVAAAATLTGGDTRLVDAARNHDLKTIRSLVSQHTDVNARSDDGSTALLWAAHSKISIRRSCCSRRARPKCRERFQNDAALPGVHQRQRCARAITPEIRRESEHGDRHRRDLH